jgi:transposase
MPARLVARPPADPAEHRRLRKLAVARHAPASWIQRARIITGSWDGATVTELAERLGCATKTVYKWLHRFNHLGVEGLGDLPRPGKPRRLTETERGRIIQLANSDPPGRLVQGGDGLLAPPDPETPAVWTLDTLTDQAQAAGIQVHRSQVRQILLDEGMRWRRTRSWITSTDPNFVPKERRSSPATPTRHPKRPWSAPTSSAR